MNWARAGLCGLALGASGAAADDDRLVAMFARCLGSVIESYEALAAEYPDKHGGFETELLLGEMRAMQEDPEGTLRSAPKSPFKHVQEMCAAADKGLLWREAERRTRDGGAQ